MSAAVHIARRYLIGLRRRTHVATVTLISLGGLAIGVFALVVSLALLEGFQQTIRLELVQRATHARVLPSNGARLEEAAALVSILQDRGPGIEVVRSVRGTVLVSSLTDAVPAAVVGRSDTREVAIDRILAARTASGIGDQLDVVAPRERLTPMGPVPVRMRVTVEDVMPPAPGEESGTVLLPLGTAQRLLWGEAVVEALELREPDDPWALGGRVRRLVDGVPGVRVEGLEELHSSLLLALALERVMIFVAVGLMLVVAALNLLCNIAMVAAEKRQDLAVLAGLGMSPRALRWLFLLLGIAIGAVGSLAGAALGAAAAVVLDLTGALPLPRGVFVVSSVPFTVRPATVAMVIAVAMLLSAGASWLPSRLVARREPAEGLRYE